MHAQKQFIISLASFLVFYLFLISCENAKEVKKQGPILQKTSEMSQMIERLRQLNLSTDVESHYHWNKRLAQLYRKKMEGASREKYWENWFLHCIELLNASEIELCIQELQQFIVDRNITFAHLLHPQKVMMLDLLALAYLRLGEV